MVGRLAHPRHGVAGGRRVLHRALAPAAVALLALTAQAAQAQPARQQLQDAEAARTADTAAARDAAERLRAAQANARALADARVANAAQLRGLELATADAAAGMDAQERRRAAAQARLAAHAAALGPLLPVALRLSLYPVETLLAVPAPPDAALTGLLVLQGVARQLEADAEALRVEEADIAHLSAGIAELEGRLATAQAAQAAQAAILDRQIADARARGQAAEDDAAAADRRAAEHAAQAGSLRAVLAQIEASRREEEARARAATGAQAGQRQAAMVHPAGPGLGEPHGALAAPVAGAVVRSFGEPGDGGPANGVSYQALPASRVVAPCGGRVVFAGPFRSYGELLILDCGGGYHFVLGGLDRLDVAVGHPVQPGEPVGVMPQWDPHAAGARPALYVELRRDGLAVNPTPFLRGRS